MKAKRATLRVLQLRVSNGTKGKGSYVLTQEVRDPRAEHKTEFECQVGFLPSTTLVFSGVAFGCVF